MINNFKSKKVFALFCSVLLATSSVPLMPLSASESDSDADLEVFHFPWTLNWEDLENENEDKNKAINNFDTLFDAILDKVSKDNPRFLNECTEICKYAFVNKKLPTFYTAYNTRTKEEYMRFINVYNKYYTREYEGLTYVMILPTFGMINEVELSPETVREYILNVDNWEPVQYDKLATSRSKHYAEGVVESLDEYIKLITPKEEERYFHSDSD